MLRNILYLLIGAILFIGLFFKFMHWPGAGPMLSVSLGGMAILLVAHAISKRMSKLWIQHIVLPAFGAAFVLGVLFKIMHWPGENLLFVVSITGISLTFFEGAYRMRKSITAIIPAVFAVTLVFALFKIMHWPTLGVLSILTLVLTASIPILLFVRGKQLKQTAPSLSIRMMMIAALSLISALIEFTVVTLRVVLNLTHSLPDIAQVFLSMGILLVIRKVIQTEDLKAKYQNDYLLIHCLGAIYIIGLVLQMMSTS